MADRRHVRATPALDVLTADERAAVLGRVLAAHPDLAPEVEELAVELLATASIDGIADRLSSELRAIPLEHLAARCGRIRGRGYVHETDAAWELLDETVEPFLDDLRRRSALGLLGGATAVATGIVAGLYRCRAPHDGTVLACAGDDAIRELADEVLRVAAGNGITLDADIADHYWPEWSTPL